MNSNKNIHGDEHNSFSISLMKESIVEIDADGGDGNQLTVINDYEEWGDDNDLQGLIATRRSFSLVSRLWTVYIIVVVVLMCILIYTFVRNGGSTYNLKSDEPWTFDI